MTLVDLANAPSVSDRLKSYEVLTIGRVGVDIYPLEIGVSLRDVDIFGKFLGGSAANVAVAAARLGRMAGVITRTGNDPFGEFVHKALVDFGVDDRYVTSVRDLPTPVTFCHLFPPDHFPQYFYRYPKAPDLEISIEDLDFGVIKNTKVFWFSLTGLSEEPSRSAHFDALRKRGKKRFTIFDLDYNSAFWNSQNRAREEADKAMEYVDVIVGNLEELSVIVGEQDPHRACQVLIDRGVDLVVVKRGLQGVLGVCAKETVELPTFCVEVVNGLGAGDGFGGALCHGLLSGWELERVLRFASAAGAIVAGKLECSGAMPTEDEVMDLLERS